MTEFFVVFERAGLVESDNLTEVRLTAKSVHLALQMESVKSAIAEAHVFGASSQKIQDTILEHMTKLGFSSEKKALFNEYSVTGLRPDYFKGLDGGGILFEVERGKTLANNMDLLDVWKTHICREAKHLFLLVPKVRATASGRNQNIFSTVQNRISTFFTQECQPIDVDSVTIFGY